MDNAVSSPVSSDASDDDITAALAMAAESFKERFGQDELIAALLDLVNTVQENQFR